MQDRVAFSDSEMLPYLIFHHWLDPRARPSQAPVPTHPCKRALRLSPLQGWTLIQCEKDVWLLPPFQQDTRHPKFMEEILI